MLLFNRRLCPGGLKSCIFGEWTFYDERKETFFFSIGFHIDALGLYRWVYYCGHPVFGFFAGNEEEGIECMIFLA